MKKVVFAFALIFFAFATSACIHIDYGPSDNIADPQYIQAAQAVMDDGETIGFMEKAYLLGNTKRPGPAQTWGVSGTVVVSENTLYFLFWNRNANAFDVLRKLPLADMINIAPISSLFGPGDYISIEDTDHRFDLLSCYEMAAANYTAERTRALLEYLNRVRKTE